MALPAEAEDTGMQATIQNTIPALVTWDAHWDPTLGAYTYAVSATDGNGVEDLSTIQIRLYATDGALVGGTTDDGVVYDGRRAASWTGTIQTDGIPIIAQLTITDSAAGESEHVRPVVPLEVSEEVAAPLAQDVQTVTTSSIPMALVVGLIFLTRARRHD